MITLPNGKICMNEQEAIQWLLDNYPIPFQCSANYAADTEIGLGTIVNPTPSKVKVGSIIFFADSKVSTVIAVNSTSFKCSEQYNDLVDDVVYVSDIQLNASGYLITTLSNGTTINAGLIKQVSSFNINSSQHLIVNYNDGTTTDLGAIFSGDVNIAGNFTANSIIENMQGYSFAAQTSANITNSVVYAGAVKNGNKLTLVIASNITRTGAVSGTSPIGYFSLPMAVANKLYPSIGTALDCRQIFAAKTQEEMIPINAYCHKNDYGSVFFRINAASLDENVTYYCRYEVTFLLSDSLAA